MSHIVEPVGNPVFHFTSLQLLAVEFKRKKKKNNVAGMLHNIAEVPEGHVIFRVRYYVMKKARAGPVSDSPLVWELAGATQKIRLPNRALLLPSVAASTPTQQELQKEDQGRIRRPEEARVLGPKSHSTVFFVQCNQIREKRAKSNVLPHIFFDCFAVVVNLKSSVIQMNMWQHPRLAWVLVGAALLCFIATAGGVEGTDHNRRQAPRWRWPDEAPSRVGAGRLIPVGRPAAAQLQLQPVAPQHSQLTGKFTPIENLPRTRPLATEKPEAAIVASSLPPVPAKEPVEAVKITSDADIDPPVSASVKNASAVPLLKDAGKPGNPYILLNDIFPPQNSIRTREQEEANFNSLHNKDLGGLDPSEVYLADDDLFVVRGFDFKKPYSADPPGPPISDYQAPAPLPPIRIERPVEFYYPTHNTTAQEPGPFGPGIFVPPPLHFFAPRNKSEKINVDISPKLFLPPFNLPNYYHKVSGPAARPLSPRPQQPPPGHLPTSQHDGFFGFNQQKVPAYKPIQPNPFANNPTNANEQKPSVLPANVQYAPVKTVLLDTNYKEVSKLPQLPQHQPFGYSYHQGHPPFHTPLDPSAYGPGAQTPTSQPAQPNYNIPSQQHPLYLPTKGTTGVSLESDIDVNYRPQRPAINPDSELIDPELLNTKPTYTNPNPTQNWNPYTAVYGHQVQPAKYESLSQPTAQQPTVAASSREKPANFVAVYRIGGGSYSYNLGGGR
ncbi:hypothetical protein DAPPUDRAFT_303225 [Daphnia pulex]|uniref:Uncharacterized protein n=1 Tax=Daphnia pulex TaxID=6669 RepID=E9FTX9_DAPPU|nr:hypothetical protein DAPPUDRAFT_303225 [Daphnia pulex]|eukprot:EFX89443.1 hypothetical protein DAPPUDRAFT_303225 [Daphnia pulex]